MQSQTVMRVTAGQLDAAELKLPRLMIWMMMRYNY